MATTAKFPAALLALVDVGGEMPGFPEATLSGSHNSSTTTITLTATVPSYWPTAGWVTIDSEIIQYAAKSGATLTGCTRASQSAYSGSAAASHNDQAKVALYLTPLQWNQLVAEVIAIQTLFGAAAFVGSTDGHEYMHEGWLTPAESTVTGTGTGGVAQGRNVWQMTTGATSGSASQVRTMIMDTVASNITLNKTRRLSLAFNLVQVDANTDFKAYLTDENVTTSPSNTARHIGVRTNGATVLVSTADGTTEQTTDITANVTANATVVINFTFDGTTVRAYVNGVLRATHATNVPIAGGTSLPCERWWLANTAAVNKVAYLNRFAAKFSAA